MRGSEVHLWTRTDAHCKAAQAWNHFLSHLSSSVGTFYLFSRARSHAYSQCTSGGVDLRNSRLYEWEHVAPFFQCLCQSIWENFPWSPCPVPHVLLRSHRLRQARNAVRYSWELDRHDVITCFWMGETITRKMRFCNVGVGTLVVKGPLGGVNLIFPRSRWFKNGPESHLRYSLDGLAPFTASTNGASCWSLVCHCRLAISTGRRHYEQRLTSLL